MPIYEYECKQCYHAFERIQKVTDEAVVFCEKCGKNSVSRLVSAPGFQLKGTGWYVTDFKDKKKASSTTADASKALSTTETVTAESSAGAKKSDAN